MPYHFNLPTIIELTVPQQAALNDPGAISVSGGPGTGKSVVSLWRHIRNHEIGEKRSLLLTYTVTLAKYLSSAAAGINHDAGVNVRQTLWWIAHEQEDFDEIIIDEAQDVTQGKYDIIKSHATEVTYGADDQQIIWPDESTTQAQLRTIFPDNEPYTLDENFRNSLQIMRFVRSALPAKLIPEVTFEMLEADNRTGNKPIIMLTGGDNDKENKAILDIVNQFKSPTHNIGILHPFVKRVNSIYEMLREAGIPCTKYVNEDAELDHIEGVHVTTFKSCKGTEFDTIIVPDFQRMRYYIRKNDIVEENDYYVTFTRAKRNLFLISDNDSTFIDASTYETEQIT
jgi:superfamily I DNA/RNA helicase